MVIKRGLYYSGQGRAATSSRQKRSRYNAVRMSRAGYGNSARMRMVRTLSTWNSGGEIKSVDTTNGSGSGLALALNQTPTVTPMNLIQEGPGFYNRIGRRIEMKSVHLTGNIVQTGTSTSTNDYVRVIVFYDRQTNGATPAVVNDLLADYDQGGSRSASQYSGVNPDERERYLILADIRLVLPSTATIGAGGPGSSTASAVDPVTTTFNINRFINLKNLNTHYKSTHSPSVIADIATGGLFVATMGSFNSGSEGWQFNSKWRLRYKDT